MKIQAELTYEKGIGKNTGIPYSYTKLEWVDEQGKKHTFCNFLNQNKLFLTKENIAALKEEYEKKQKK